MRIKSITVMTRYAANTRRNSLTKPDTGIINANQPLIFIIISFQKNVPELPKTVGSGKIRRAAIREMDKAKYQK